MGQRVIVDANNNVQVIAVGPIGPTGLPGPSGEQSDQRVVTMLLPPAIDLSDELLDAVLTSPNATPRGLTIAIIGRGTYDGIYEGQADETGPAPMVLKEAFDYTFGQPRIVLFAQSILTLDVLSGLSSPIPGLWATSRDTSTDGWWDPVNLVNEQSGSTLTVTLFVAAPDAFASVPEGMWPVPPSMTIAFTNQTDAENNGIYVGTTTDPEDPRPLAKIGNLPSHDTLILTSVWVETNEVFDAALSGGFGSIPPEEVVYDVLGPFILGWNEYFLSPGAWAPLTIGFGALTNIVNHLTNNPLLVVPSVYSSDLGSAGAGTITLVIPYTSFVVELSGSITNVSGISFEFENPGANKTARFRLNLNYPSADTGLGYPSIPGYVQGSDTISDMNGSVEVLVIGQETPDVGEPAAVMLVGV